MAKLFYDHLIIIEEIVAILDAHHLSAQEKQKMLSVIDEMFHHMILDTILTYIPKKHHEEFLKKLVSFPHDPQMIMYLNEKSEKNMEKEILKTITKGKKRIIKEIENSLYVI